MQTASYFWQRVSLFTTPIRMSPNGEGGIISAEVLHIAPLMMMRCHICKGTTSSLCTEIRGEHVEPGRSVLKLQQHQRSQSLDTHTQTLIVYTLNAHMPEGEKACGNGGEG